MYSEFTSGFCVSVFKLLYTLKTSLSLPELDISFFLEY